MKHSSHLLTTLLALTTALALRSLAAEPPAAPTNPATVAPTEPPQTEAQPAAKATPSVRPPPILNVPYGTHEGQVLDFYPAKSDQPTPVLIHIHGGGWTGGDKSEVIPSSFLRHGIAVASINYRFVSQAQLAGAKPPVSWPMHDAARAVQFLRSKAAEWNIDKARIGATGGSAGACTALWLAFHDDLAEPKSHDPIARESTRLWCVAVMVAQTSLDPQQCKEWTPNSRYGGHAFGFFDANDLNTRDARFAEFLANRKKILPWIKEYSPYGLVTRDDPPVYLEYPDPPALGQAQKDPTHTANFGVKLQERCQKLGVPCELVYPGAPNVKHPRFTDYLLEVLKAPSAKPQ